MVPKTKSARRRAKFTIEAARCIGCCSLAPAIMVDDRVYGRVKLNDLARILKDYE